MSGGELVAAVQATLPAWLAASRREFLIIKRSRWAAVMTAALGSSFDNYRECEELFVRHSLLVHVARVAARALGADVDVAALGLEWPGEALVNGLVEALAGVDWEIEADVLGPVYAALISAETRKGAGEHYTPDWLAERVLAEVMSGRVRVMDPSCGSGTFVFHAVRRFLREPGASVDELLTCVRGVDVHPIAAALARVNYLRAIGRERIAGRELLTVPISSGDGMRVEDEVDALVGNPPWLALRFMAGDVQAEFRARCEDYNLWAGGAVATHQDLCGLFVVRVIERCLREGGRFGFVMPGAVLDRGQFLGFRGGRYGEKVCVDFSEGWDLRRARPHVFPVGAAVVFGTRTERAGRTLRATEVWSPGGRAVAESVRGEAERSAYHARFRQGATLVPRVLAIVERDGPRVRSVRSAYEKTPWRGLTGLVGEVEEECVWPVLLGEHVVPYRAVASALAVLPRDAAGWVDETRPGFKSWWSEAEARWRAHRVSEKLSLREQLDYQQKLAGQFPVAPLRVVYTKSGMHLTAAKSLDRRAVVDHTLYWAAVESDEEADYLCALLNAGVVTRMVRPLMAYGKDERHIDKHVWRLPIPLYDPGDALHGELVRAARTAAAEVAGMTARRDIRRYLADSAVGREIEGIVGQLLRLLER